MSMVEEVLRRHGYVTTEDDLAQRLDALLSEDRIDVAGDMSAVEMVFLTRYSGVEQAAPHQLADLQARSAARLTVEAARSLSRSQIAELLGVAPSRISHQVAAGKLFTYQGSGRRPLFPDWQIMSAPAIDKATQRARVLPRLGEVLTRLPRSSHPLTVRTFMTTPTMSLVSGAGTATSPRDWLVSGGDADPVAELAATLGEQV